MKNQVEVLGYRRDKGIFLITKYFSINGVISELYMCLKYIPTVPENPIRIHERWLTEKRPKEMFLFCTYRNPLT